MMTNACVTPEYFNIQVKNISNFKDMEDSFLQVQIKYSMYVRCFVPSGQSRCFSIKFAILLTLLAY